jgi:hypothetical protein
MPVELPMTDLHALTELPSQPQLVLVPADTSNAAFFERHAAPGRIGLVGMTTWVDRSIRRAQRRLTEERLHSLWSHAFLLEGRRADGRQWLLESDLDIHGHFVRLGVQENRADKYHDQGLAPTCAILDFGLDSAQVEAVLTSGLDLLATRTRYSIPKAVASYVALRRQELGRRFTRKDEKSLYCSAFVAHCYAAAGIELAPGIDEDHTLPELLAATRVPHTMYLLQRVGA